MEKTATAPQDPAGHTHQSPARRLGLGMNMSRSATSNFAVKHPLYDGRCTALVGGSSASGEGELAPQGSQPSVHSKGLKGTLDEWFGGEVLDMSGGSLTHPGGPSDVECPSPTSFTEGRVSAAERLQAMLCSAASVGGDEAASYLQQLLIPDLSSTASVDLQYSTHSTRIPSMIALAYGSSGGPAVAAVTATAPVPGVSNLWGLLQNSNSPLACGAYVDVFAQASPATTTASGAAAAAAMGCSGGGGGGQVPHLSAYQVHSLNGVLGPRPSTGDNSSGPYSRQGSEILTFQTAPSIFGTAPSYSCIAAGALGGSVISTPNVNIAPLEAAGSVDAHSNKSAEQLVEELRELHAAAAAAAKVPAIGITADDGEKVAAAAEPARRTGGSARPASTSAAMAAQSVTITAGTDIYSSSDNNNYTAVAVAAAAESPLTPRQQQQRDELVSALWRLLRAKDSEAVSYLLALDPATKLNRHIAPLLAEMRSWVYLNMW